MYKHYRPMLEMLEDRLAPASFLGSGLSSQLASWQWRNPATNVIEVAPQLPGPQDNVSVMPMEILTIDQNVTYRGLSVGLQQGTLLTFADNASYTLSITTAAGISGSYIDLQTSTISFSGVAVFVSPVINGDAGSRIVLEDGCSSQLVANGYAQFNTTLQVGSTGGTAANSSVFTMRGRMDVTNLNTTASGQMIWISGEINGYNNIINAGNITLRTPGVNDTFICHPLIQNWDNGTFTVDQGTLLSEGMVMMEMAAQNDTLDEFMAIYGNWTNGQSNTSLPT